MNSEISFKKLFGGFFLIVLILGILTNISDRQRCLSSYPEAKWGLFSRCLVEDRSGFFLSEEAWLRRNGGMDLRIHSEDQ